MNLKSHSQFCNQVRDGGAEYSSNPISYNISCWSIKFCFYRINFLNNHKKNLNYLEWNRHYTISRDLLLLLLHVRGEKMS